LTGLVLGLAWAALDAALGLVFFGRLWSWLSVLALVLLTGGLHLDGLADTADGLLSHQGPDRSLEIMRDSRTGVWGVLALVAVLGLKAGALETLDGGWPRAACLIFIPAYARTGMLFLMARLPYGRGRDGLAAGMFSFSRSLALKTGGAVFLLSLFFVPWPCLVLSCALAVSVMGVWYFRALGCVTGDMLGAAVELSETLMLLALAV
jgi:adenosylcobinamide-GDP ribazoletransferase